MTKIYKINGKQIINDWTKTSPAQVMEQLLEALSDKEEGNRKCEHGVYPIYECKKCIKQALEEPNQEECFCGNDFEGHVHTKQSTSLKEEIYQILDNHFGGFETFNNNKPTEQIISLFKTHLLEEIEKQGKMQAPENYDIPMARESIINLIKKC